MLLSRPNKIEVLDGGSGELPVTLAEREIYHFHVSHNKSSMDYGQPTTAIVLNDNVFLVLNDPHQYHWEAIQKVITRTDSVRNAMDYFSKNIEHANYRSEHFYYNIPQTKDDLGLRKMVISYLGEDWLESVLSSTKKSP